MENNLRNLQLMELEILKEFIRVCETLKLQYFVAGGTCLGAVRHKGFIPWDDDIDVAMPREDYEIFMKEGQNLLKDRFFLQNYHTDPNYVNNFAKIRNSQTTFIEKTCKNIEMNQGVYIDIFPLDGFPKSKIEYKLINFRKQLIHFQFSKKYWFIENKKCGIKSKLALLISDVLYGRKTLRQLQDIQEKMYAKYPYKTASMIIAYGGAYGYKDIHKKNVFENGSKLDFEGIKVCAPKQVDNYLKRMYGDDYMKLPPKGKRGGHHSYEIMDLNKSYTEYI